MDPIQQGHRTHLTFSQHWKFFSKKIDKNFRVPQVAFWLHCQGGKSVIWQIGYKLTLVIHIKGKSSALFVTRFDHTFSVRQILNGGNRKELIQSILIQRQQQDHNSPTPKASEIWNLCWFASMEENSNPVARATQAHMEADEEERDPESNSLQQPLLKRSRTLSSSPLALVGAKVSHIESLDYE